jgi:peptidoglycan hydrolase-like protein with peptidoglycan-binding domain
MGLLKCQLFQTPPAVRDRLEQCLLRDAFHITPGSRGEHVRKIQIALNRLSRGPGRENFNLKEDSVYGPRTAAAVKKYKDAPSRKIRQPGQKTADDIVGKRTIKSLDDEMDILENELSSASQFVSLTVLGAPHDHSKCPKSGFSRPGSDGRVHHMATPINPLGTGRKINIGGEDETKYLGFQDFSTRDPQTGGPPVGSPPGRPFTEDLPPRCASDICLRDAPINAEIRKEISRLALPGCRLTVAQNRLAEINSNRQFLLSLGSVLEDVFVFDDTDSEGLDHEVVVIRMRGDGRYVDLPLAGGSRIFPPGRVLREGSNAQVLDP